MTTRPSRRPHPCGTATAKHPIRTQLPRMTFGLRHPAIAAGKHVSVVLTLGYCVLRWGEMAALRVQDLDLLRLRLTVAQNAVGLNGHVAVGTRRTTIGPCRYRRSWSSWSRGGAGGRAGRRLSLRHLRAGMCVSRTAPADGLKLRGVPRACPG
jgi:hypothetical protein